MKITLGELYSRMVDEEQESILVLDDLEVRGKVCDLHAMLNDEVLSARVQLLRASEKDTLTVFATLLDERKE